MRTLILGLITQQVCAHNYYLHDNKSFALLNSTIQIDIGQLSRFISQNLKILEESIRQQGRTCTEMNQLQDDFERKSQEIERSRHELDILSYQMPPSHRIFAVQRRISATEAEVNQLEERMIEVKAIIEDYERKSRSIKNAISKSLEGYETVKDSETAQLEALQSKMVTLEKKLLMVTEAKDNEIKSCKTRLKHQRIKLTTEHRAVYEKQERHFMKTLRETEGRCQKALRSAETQYVAELRSKNQKIENLESKVQKLEAQLSVRQSTVQSKVINWFRRKKSISIDESKRRGTIQKGYHGGESKNDSKYSIHPRKEHDQASSHVSTISPPFCYDRHSLHSLPAMHFREIVERDRDQSSLYHTCPNKVISPQKSEDFSKGYQSEPEDDNIPISLNPRMDSKTAAV